VGRPRSDRTNDANNQAKAASETLVADAQEVKTSDNALSAKLGLPTTP